MAKRRRDSPWRRRGRRGGNLLARAQRRQAILYVNGNPRGEAAGEIYRGGAEGAEWEIGSRRRQDAKRFFLSMESRGGGGIAPAMQRTGEPARRFTAEAQRAQRDPLVIDHLTFVIGHFGLLVLGDC